MTHLIFAATCDIAGKTRGKAFPESDLERRLIRGVGWTPTNVQINCFDGIAETPFGALGDLLLVPDKSARVDMNFGSQRESFILGDIVTLEGNPWELCTRTILRKALTRLHKVSGLKLRAAFEHEFQLKSKSGLEGEGFGRAGFERHRALCETIVTHITGAGLKLDSIMKEYGPEQYEVVIAPEEGVKAADAAVIVREIVRSVARQMGEEATFSPICDPSSVGNGVHIHMSFADESGAPATYDPKGNCGMSRVTDAFVAGVLKYLDSILALTAASVISYLRLTPHRWSAAYNNLGFQDREASVRICPVTSQDPNSVASQFNIEYRAADASACPHLALAAIVHAGVQGIEDKLKAPQATTEDLSLLSEKDLKSRGFIRLPESLESAITQMNKNPMLRSWFSNSFIDIYTAHKKSEMDHVKDLDDAAICAIYERTY